MAATRDLQIPQRLSGRSFGYKVKGGVRIFNNALCGLDTNGFACPLGHADAVVFAGICDTTIDNRDGGDGYEQINLLRDTRGFIFDVTPSDLNKDIFALDDDTLSLNATGAKRIGNIVGLGDGRVWVDLLG